MQIRVIRKSLGMLLAYFVIIIGIFVLQFRTDSSIMEKIRNLHITLEKSDETNSPFALKNKMQLTYNGLNLYFDDQKPAYAIKTRTNQSENLKLVDWKKGEDSFDLFFTNDVVLHLSLSDEDETSAADSDSTFFASVSLPEQYSALFLPFKSVLFGK